MNTPKRGLGEKAVQTIFRAARDNGVNMFEGARLAVSENLIRGKGGKTLAEFLKLLATFHARVLTAEARKAEILARLADLGDPDAVIEEDTESRSPKADQKEANKLRKELTELARAHVDMAEQILDQSGYTEMWQNDKTPEAAGRLENLKELVKALENFPNLQGFLEHVALVMDNDREDAEEKVSIMTLHAAKGLEFPAIFLPGWEDGLFPSQRSMDEQGLKGLEEERRLAYVGLTRAEEYALVSFAGNRFVYGSWQSQMPSRFIDEMDASAVEVLTAPGLYGGRAAQPEVQSDLYERASRADGYNSPGWRRLQAKSGPARHVPAP